MADQELIDSLYASMLKIRMVEEAIAEEYPKREMRTPVHLHIGQEAIPAAFCTALKKNDYIFGYYRSHGWYLAKGGNLNRMMGELFTKTTGCSGGYGGSMHLIDLEVGYAGTTAIVAGAMPHAVGAAFAFKTRKTGQIALSCFGDAATEEGLFQESLMFAALRKLPVIFVCENNGLATNTWIQERQPPVPIHERAKGFGVATLHIDGNNALEVYDAANKAVARARGGKGPTFIECRTYRYFEHCGPNYDVQLGIRTMDEVNEWKKRDPLTTFEKLVSKDIQDKLRAQIRGDIAHAFEEARKAPYPTSILPEGMSCQR